MNWLGPVAFIVGLVLAGVGVAYDIPPMIVIGVFLAGGGYVLMRKG